MNTKLHTKSTTNKIQHKFNRFFQSFFFFSKRSQHFYQSLYKHEYLYLYLMDVCTFAISGYVVVNATFTHLASSQQLSWKTPDSEPSEHPNLHIRKCMYSRLRPEQAKTMFFKYPAWSRGCSPVCGAAVVSQSLAQPGLSTQSSPSLCPAWSEYTE